MSLLQMSFSGAIFILVIVVMRAIAINKLPKNMFLVLWGIALMRLMVPISVPSAVSVYSLLSRNVDINTLDNTPIGNVISGIPGLQTNPDIVEFKSKSQLLQSSGSGNLQVELTSSPRAVKRIQFVSAWFVIWCVGMVFGIIFVTVFYLRWYFKLRTALPVHNDYVEQWLSNHKLKRQIFVKQSDRVIAPLTYGVLHPVILLPKKIDWENTEQLQYVLLHEYVHIRRFDTITKLIATLALCIHWFNPFVWVMYILFNRDMELSCDDNVVRLSGITTRSDYARVLIDMEARKSGLMPLYNNFSKNAIRFASYSN